MGTTPIVASAMTVEDRSVLFERVTGRIHRYFRRMTRNAHDADDCVQETLLLLERSLTDGTYDPTRSFRVWLWLKARTVFAKWCRRRERDGVAALEAEPIADDDATQRIDDTVDAQWLLDQIRRQVGEEAFEAFILYYEADLDQAEVGLALGRNRKTIRKRLRAAHAVIDRLL